MEYIAPSDVTSRNDARAEYSLGEVIRTQTDKTFKYVRLVDCTETAPAAGQVLYRHKDDDTYAGGLVTNDLTYSLNGDVNDVVGVLTYGCENSNCSFMQTWGYYSAVALDPYRVVVVSERDGLIGSTDGAACSSVEDTSARQLGHALAAEIGADDTVAAFLTIEQ